MEPELPHPSIVSHTKQPVNSHYNIQTVEHWTIDTAIFQLIVVSPMLAWLVLCILNCCDQIEANVIGLHTSETKQNPTDAFHHTQKN